MKIGIPVLDDIFGDVPAKKTLTYYIDPEAEGNVFAMQTLFTNLELGHNCALVISTMDPHTVRRNFKEYGWILDDLPNFSLVDAYSGYIGSPSNEEYVVKDPSNIEQLDKAVCKAIEENDMVTFGSLSTIIDICGEEALSYVQEWSKYAKLNNTFIVYSFVTWPYPENVMDRINELSNAIIKVGGVHHRVVLGQYYGILKSDWVEVKNTSILFKLLKPGGVRAYIPKILVTGPFSAGKSSFVQAMSSKSVSVDRLGTTVALDHGHVDYKGFSIDIFGTPGQERFDPVLKLLGKKALGVILVVDSTDQTSLFRAKEMLYETTKFGLPYVIAANKQDLEHALSPEEIRKKMNLSFNIPIVPTAVKSVQGVHDVMDALLDLLVGDENG
ncbi:MAG: GTP-binding protein [Archaeoglobaceae archaeon]